MYSDLAEERDAMTAPVNNLPAVAPPEDPVRAALDDPVVADRLLRQAHALLHRRAGVQSVEIDDVLQKTKLRAIESRLSFDGTGRPVGPWLYGVLVNVVREEVRAARCRPAQHPADQTLWEKVAVAPAASDTDAADHRVLVERILNRLPAAFRAAVQLRYLDELEYPEIAGRLKITTVNARMKVCRGLKLLRDSAGVAPGEERP